MAFLDNVFKFLKSNWMTILLVVVLVSAAVYYYMYGFNDSMGYEAIPESRTVKVPQVGSRGAESHLAVVNDDDFNYLDLSKSIVVPVTDPTNDAQSFTKHVDERGMTIWEPNVMMDPTDILSDEDFNRAADAARPTMWEGQLKRLTTPSVLQKDGSMFWGTPWPEGGPGTDRYCITKDDLVHKGIYSQDSDFGTWGTGGCV